MNRYLQVGILIVLAAAALFLLPHKQQSTPSVANFEECQKAGGSIYDGEPVTCVMPNGQTFAEQEALQPEVVVDRPQYGELVTSPLQISGKARGQWFFEANLPVTLKDDTGKILIRKGLTAQADWMTTDYVPFAGSLEFTTDAQYGVLIIEKDNPSGDPQFDSSFAVPVRFR